MGELHLEITEYRIVNEQGIPIITSEPIVVYRETVTKLSPQFEGKSPNKHNKFYIEVLPIEDEVYKAIKNGDLPQGKLKTKKVSKELVKMGVPKTEAKGAYAVFGNNILVNASRGVQYLHETKELIIDAFKEAMALGPLSRERVNGVKVRLMDANLHEDAIHRGPAQIIPAVRSAIYGAMMTVGTMLTEPIVDAYITAPQDYMGAMSKELGQRRANILEMNTEGDMTIIKASAPVAEMFGFSSSVRSATQGRALWTTEFKGFESLPFHLQEEITTAIRTRKGLKPQPPSPSYYGS
jgi:elongation factor 2